MGHLYYLTSRIEEARDCYERTLAYTTEASDMHAIYLRLASIYLEKGEVSSLLTNRAICGDRPLCYVVHVVNCYNFSHLYLFTRIYITIQLSFPH